MDYELIKSKREKASIIPIEEVYTDLDIKDNDPYEPSIGYRFDTPRRWAQDKSKNKSIGIRDLKLTPSSGDIHFRFIHALSVGVDCFPVEWVQSYVINDQEEEEEEEDEQGLIGHYEIGYDTHTFVTFGGVCLYITNDLSENITPANGLEEIVTDILHGKLNGSIWRQMRKAQKAADYSYLTYSQKSTAGQLRALYYNAANGSAQFVANKKALPIPSVFRYNYDSSTCVLNVDVGKNLRLINMTNGTSLSDIDENGAVPLNKYKYENIEEVDGATHKIQSTQTVVIHNQQQQQTAEITHAYNQSPTPVNSELLMITEERNSLKSIYNLFNQPFPQTVKLVNGRNVYEDDFDAIATIWIDGTKYYVPFIHNIGNGLITPQGSPYTSYFCLNYKQAGRTISSNARVSVSNLNLSNVWDRIHLIYHTSFAETRTRMIGRNGDHWDSPNKRFMVPGGDQDEFYLRFTTDGKHNVLPVGCHFNVDLCFMLNTTNNTATGNHDMFK